MSMVDEELLSAVKMELREKEEYRKSAEHFANAFYKALHRNSKSGRKILQLQNRIRTLKRKCNVLRSVIKSDKEMIANLIGVIDQQKIEIDKLKKCANCKSCISLYDKCKYDEESD